MKARSNIFATSAGKTVRRLNRWGSLNTRVGISNAQDYPVRCRLRGGWYSAGSTMTGTSTGRQPERGLPLTWLPDPVSDELGVLVPLIVGLDDAVSDDDADAELVAVWKSERWREGKRTPPTRNPAFLQPQLPRLAKSPLKYRRPRAAEKQLLQPRSCGAGGCLAACGWAGVRSDWWPTSEAVLLALLVWLSELDAVDEGVSELLAVWDCEAVADCGGSGRE